jgi:hypothetical protein
VASSNCLSPFLGARNFIEASTTFYCGGLVLSDTISSHYFSKDWIMSDEKLALEWMRQQAHKIDPYLVDPSFEECVELIDPAFKKGKSIAQLRFLLGEADRRAGAAERKHAALKFAKEKSPNAGQILRLQSKLQQVQLALKLATGDNNMTISQFCSEYDVSKRDGNTAWNEKLVQQNRKR